MPVNAITADEAMRNNINLYIGSQPSIMRRALAALGPVEQYGFLDLGCGKGRPLIVATEFPFRAITGVEFSPALAAIARRNAALIARRFPNRTQVSIIEADAAALPPFAGNIVIFIYNAFGETIMRRLLDNLEASLDGPAEHIFIVSYNPVCAHLLDASPAWERWWAETCPYAEEEIGHGFDIDDLVVIWQSVKNSAPTPHAGAQRKIKTISHSRVELEAN